MALPGLFIYTSGSWRRLTGKFPGANGLATWRDSGADREWLFVSDYYGKRIYGYLYDERQQSIGGEPDAVVELDMRPDNLTIQEDQLIAVGSDGSGANAVKTVLSFVLSSKISTAHRWVELPLPLGIGDPPVQAQVLQGIGGAAASVGVRSNGYLYGGRILRDDVWRVPIEEP